MAHPLGDTHPAQLLPGQANRAQDTVLPLPGNLVGKRCIDQIDNADQEDQTGKRLKASKNNAALHFLIFDMCGYGIHSKIAAAGYQLLQAVFHRFRFFRVADNAPGIVKAFNFRMELTKQLLRCKQSRRIHGKRTMSVCCLRRIEQSGYGNCHGFLAQGQLNSSPNIHIGMVLLITRTQKDAVGICRHGARYPQQLLHPCGLRPSACRTYRLRRFRKS